MMPARGEPPLSRAAILAVAAAGAVHLGFMARAGAESGDWVVAFLAWLLAILGLRDDLCPGIPRTRTTARVAGILLLLFALMQCARMAQSDLWFLKLLPFLLGCGAVLSIQGAEGVLCNWRAWVVLAVAVTPNSALAPVLDPGRRLTDAHAAMGGFILQYLGFDVHMNGPLLCLPSGTVQVEGPCSGFSLMVILLKVAFIAGIALSLRRPTGLMIGAVGLGVGLAVGVLRVAVLAAVLDHPAWFARLHGATGKNLFPALGFLCFAPFLAPAEKPLADLILRFHASWKSSSLNPAQFRSLHASAALSLICACGLTGLAGNAPDRLPQPLHALALCQESVPPCQLAIPSGLRTRRENSIAAAWRWSAGNPLHRWSVVICSISNAGEGPHELLESPELRNFIRERLAESLPKNWAVPAPAREKTSRPLGMIMTPTGLLAYSAIDARGRTFLSSGEYFVAQNAAFKDPRTWLQWLCTGRRLKDTRYWLVVMAANSHK